MARDIKKIDAKGRFFLPSKLKEKFGGDLVATISLDEGYICVYTAENFKKIEAQFEDNNFFDPVVRMLARTIIGESLELSADSQGRLTLTGELWEYIGAKPGEEICIIDTLGKLEICRKTYYDEHRVNISKLSGLDEKYYVKGL